MKICILCPGWPGKVNSWNGIFIKEQVNNLVDAGCEVSVVTARVFNEDPAFETDSKVKIHRFWFPSERKLLAEYKKIPVLRILLYLISGIYKSFRQARKQKAGLIHSHFAIPSGFMAVVVGKYLLKKPVILTAHDSDVAVWSQESWLAKKIINFTLQHTDKIISVSPMLRSLMIDRFNIDPEKIEVIPLGINRELFKPINKQEARQKLNLAEKEKIILFIGALLEIKGIKYLLEAIPEVLAKHKDVLFLLVGSGPLEKSIKHKIKQLKIEDNVRVCGAKPHEEMPLWLNAANAFVLPSLSEGLPVTLIEASATDTPIIATRVGSIPEIIHEGINGLLVDSENSRQLADKIDLLLKDKQLALELANSKSTILKEFDSQVSAKKIIKIYAQFLNDVP